jgi:hypothetical protein
MDVEEAGLSQQQRILSGCARQCPAEYAVIRAALEVEVEHYNRARNPHLYVVAQP